MKSKKDLAKAFLEKNDPLLLCPVCGQDLLVNDDYSLKCSRGHSFDISKKGVINLIGKSNQKIYDNDLFESRRKVINSNFYEPLTEKLSEIIIDNLESKVRHKYILDAGCGEGSFLHSISDKISKDDRLSKREYTLYDSLELSFVGIDLSKHGVDMASDYSINLDVDSDGTKYLWLVDDIANIHLKSGKTNVILNILSPANYNEFGRLLTDNGVVIKVLPGHEYLKELRVATDLNIESESIPETRESNALAEIEMEILEKHQLQYQLNLAEDEFRTFAKMTPLTYGKELNPEKKTTYPLTIDLVIIVGRPF